MDAVRKGPTKGKSHTPANELYWPGQERIVEAVQQLSLARDIGRITEIVRHEARQLTGADGASFVLREGDLCYYADEEAISPLWKGERFPVDACVSGWAMQHRQPVAIENIYADTRVPAEAYRPTFVKSLLMVPIRASAPIGAIGNYWDHQHRPTDQEIHLLQALANSTAVALENVQLYASLETRIQERTKALEREIAERRQAERALQESERRLALALEASHSAVWEMDVATEVVRGTDLLYTMIGYQPGELATLADWINLVHEGDRQCLPEMIGEIIQGRRDRYSAEFRVRAKDGSWHWILCQALAAERNGQGHVSRLVGTRKDITERKRLEEQLRRHNEQLDEEVRAQTAELRAANAILESSNQELQQFAYVAAHDLQTPLRAIVGFAQLLQKGYEGRFDAKADQWLTALDKAAKRMHVLITDLLDYSRVDSQGRRFEQVSMRQIFNDVRAALDDSIRAAGARVTSRGLPEVVGDATQLAQVLQNLIENALKYRSEAPPTIEVQATLRNGEWLFAVRDNGIGIAKKYWEGIFDIFKRLHTQEQYPGTGIGLAVCRRVIHRHGGRIWVESAPGRGSTFYFTLPALVLKR